MRKTVVAVLVGLLALSGCSGGSADSAGETRDLVHAMGTTKIPVQPKRVVVLDTDKIDTALSLGVVPVGAATAAETNSLPGYLKLDPKKTALVGTLQTPSLEKIAALKPDLILGSKFRQPELYDELTKIAPTVYTEKVGVTWKENFLLDGDALGKGAQARKLLADYETRARGVGKPQLKISVVRFMPTEIRVYGPDSFAGIVLRDAGYGRPERQLLATREDKRFDKVSSERVSEVDGDVLFVAAYGEKSAQKQADTAVSPLWQGLSAVKAGRSHVVSDETWMTGIGVTAANRILDDLQKYAA
ncbi:ABC transporter substrate-binding protein [Longispora urticae]